MSNSIVPPPTSQDNYHPKLHITAISITRQDFARYMQAQRLVVVTRTSKGHIHAAFYHPGRHTIKRLEAMLLNKIKVVTSDTTYYDLTR